MHEWGRPTDVTGKMEISRVSFNIDQHRGRTGAVLAGTDSCYARVGEWREVMPKRNARAFYQKRGEPLVRDLPQSRLHRNFRVGLNFQIFDDFSIIYRESSMYFDDLLHVSLMIFDGYRDLSSKIGKSGRFRVEI